MKLNPDIDHIHRLTDNLLSQGFYMYSLPEKKVVWVNERLKNVLKVDETNFFEALMPGEEEGFHYHISQAKDLADNTFGTFLCGMITPNGNKWHVDRYTVYTRDEEDSPVLVLGIKADITHYKERETGYRQAIYKLQECLSASHIGTWEVVLETAEVIWDDEMYRIHDLVKSPDLNIYESMKRISIGDDFERVYEIVTSSMKSQSDFTAYYRIRHSNGEIRHLRCHGRFLFQDGAVNLFGVTLDNTIQVQTEHQVEVTKAQLIASAKMAALGEMSAGIAHEINNPLTVIQARAFQLSEMAENNNVNLDKLREAAEGISYTADRIAKIIKSLRTYAREGSNDPFDLVPVHQLIEETLEFCGTRFANHGVEVRIKPVNPDLEVECRLIQIEQVLLNLLNNAYDAIENSPVKWIEIEVQEEDNFVVISVTDSGSGLTPEIVEKLIQPFYTTKEVGKGTGLGLAISEGIARSHNGALLYDSSKKNTCFTLKLPRLQP